MMHNITKIFIFHYSQTMYNKEQFYREFDYHMKLHPCVKYWIHFYKILYSIFNKYLGISILYSFSQYCKLFILY